MSSERHSRVAPAAGGLRPVLMGLVWGLTVLAMSGTAEVDSRVEHGFAENQGVKLHYALLGKGPLIVLLHGFPDFWYTWRHQMEGLSDQYQLAAMDLRGYNQSGQPEGAAQYDMRLLVSDVAAVIRHLGKDRAIVVGHDWGGAIAWQFAMTQPAMVEKLIILNLPHPRGLMRELANNPAQQKNSAYARTFQKPDAYRSLTPEALAGWVTDATARPKYIEAFRRSSIQAMLHYYQRNYPQEPYREDTRPLPHVQCPVLMIHGLKDEYLLPGALSGTWDWLDKDLTLVTVPGAGHFVQQDAADLVTRTMRSWLSR